MAAPTKHRVSATAAGAVVGVLLVVGLAVLAAMSGSKGAPTAVPADSARLSPVDPNAERFTEILDSDGNVAGYVETALMSEALDKGEPRLALGSGRYPAYGYEVFDNSGEQLTGYFLIPHGFVSLAVARDDAAVDRILAPPDGKTG